MKIVCFSDLHGQYSKKLTEWFMDNPADLLLFAGDLQLNNFDDGIKFIDWLNVLPYKEKVFIFGNHDGNYDYTEDYVAKFKNIHCLNNENIDINGIKIFGSPYSIKFFDWWFMKSDRQLAKIYSKIPENTNILLTHTPPFGIMDKTISGNFAGSESLLKRIDELSNLKHHIFGHIHENFGIEKIGNINFINASILDEKYKFKRMPIIFEY
jgi:Icc-related predicted phosphoesterase